MARNKKRWSDFSTGQRTAVIVGVIVEAVLTTFALVDLALRPASQVRGPKLGWVLASVVQPIGPIAYLRFGRRR